MSLGTTGWTWCWRVPNARPLSDFPDVGAWHDRMIARDSSKKAVNIKERLMDDQSLMPKGMPKGVDNIAEYEAKMEWEGDA